MKKLFSISLAAMLILLAGCGAKPDYKVEINQPFVYKQGQPSTLAVAITENDEAATGLKVHAEMAMLDMDHGTNEVDLEETEDGIYSGEVQLEMAGKWEIVFTIEKDGEKSEEVLEYEVEESKGVATVNGELITHQDIEFYRFINKLHIAIGKEENKKKLQGEELKNANAYLDAQEKQIENQNTLLTQIIRLRAMAILGEEKGYKAEEAEVKAEIDKIKAQYNQYDVAKQMILEYGVENFWTKQEQQYQLIVLSQKVQNDVINKVKEENPDVNEQEIQFQAQKEYEELLVSQVNSLDIKIL
jgi:YtkA-like